MRYRIGLDIGISSVGWAVIEHNEKDDPVRIERIGVRVFNAAENPKDGSSCAVDRRIARGLRRRLRRRKERLLKAKEYMSSVLLNENHKRSINRYIFKLRAKALDYRILDEELYSVILYLIKHRGFKSNRKSETKSGEAGKVLTNVGINSEYVKAKGYRTIGECIYKDDKYFQINSKGEKEYKVRNHPVVNGGTYDNCFGRADLEHELITILNSQKTFGNTKITQEFINDIVLLFNKQRSFDDGPNEPSKYKSNFAVGKDIFEPEEYRAPKGSFTFEYFNALQKLNHLQIVSNNQKRKLTNEEIQKILKLLFSGKAVTYTIIRKTINMNPDEFFVGISYVNSKKDSQNISFDELITKCEKSLFFEFKFAKSVCKVLEIELKKEYQDLIDTIGLILSMRKSDDARRNALLLQDDLIDRMSESQKESLKLLNNEQIEKIIELETSKFGSLSFKSMQKIIPYLEYGETYDKACEKAGYNFNNAYGNKTQGEKIVWANIKDRLQDITSPVVLRSISQTIKVVNAIISVYGSPCAIFVELAREMQKNFNERRKITNSNNERQKINEQIVAKLKSWGISPSGQDIVKFRLYEEQQGKCAYSGKSFDKELGGVQNIFLNNNTQIDHIIPYSKCFDDSYNNKVLVLSSENQKKGNRLPYEYMTKEQFESFEEFVGGTYKNNPKKMQNLLKQKLSNEEANELNNRALNDTRYASKFILSILKDYLIFENSKFSKVPVRAINGAMTAYLRKLWGINKIRFENDRHHAIDACVIACCTSNAINLVSRYLQFKDYRQSTRKLQTTIIDGKNCYIDEEGLVISNDEYDKLFGPDIPKPYKHFVKELTLRSGQTACSESAKAMYQMWGYTNTQIDKVKEVFVSRMPTRGVKGPIHKQTIRRLKKEQGKKPVVVTKTSLNNLIFKNDDIVGYPEENKISDPLLYNALIKRIKMFPIGDENKPSGYDVKKAFSTPFFKPKSNGQNGPIVKKVKIESVGSDFVELSNMSAAENSRIVRVDVFQKENKNYLVPIYVADVYKGILPNKAIRQGYSKEDWKEMTDEYKFKFSLYPNDLIFVESRKGLKGKEILSNKKRIENAIFSYFIGVNIANGAIDFRSQDNAILFESVGAASIQIEKYTVDVLGNISKINKEKRMAICLKQK